MKRIYSDKYWEEYVERVEDNFQLKTYPQFDPYFYFPEEKEKIRLLVSDPTFEKIKSHGFIPFVKILQKTPRYRYQESENDQEEGYFALETKTRPISFASHFDTYIYGFYSYALNQIYQQYICENGFDEVVLAYRNDLNGKCNIQFAKEAFDQVKQMITEQGECSVIALDIKGYFDHIDHKILKEMWSKVIGEKELPLDQYKVYRSLTKYSYVNFSSFLKHFHINLKKLEKDQRKKNEGKKRVPRGYQSLFDLIQSSVNGAGFHSKIDLLRKRHLITENRDKDRKISSNGIPQGSPMSAILSNIYLSDFDREIYKKGQAEGFVYRRYCDDLLIICPTEHVNSLKNYLMNLIAKEYKLTIQDKKTEVIDFRPYKNGTIRSFKRQYNKKTEKFDQLPSENRYFRNLQYLGFEFNGQNIYIRPSSLSRYYRKMKGRIFKTVSMAYSPNSKGDTIFKRQLFNKYSHIGKRNFITYALNASKKYYVNSKGERKEGMNSPSIRRQISAHMRILKQEIKKTSEQRAERKGVDQAKE